VCRVRCARKSVSRCTVQQLFAASSRPPRMHPRRVLRCISSPPSLSRGRRWPRIAAAPQSGQAGAKKIELLTQDVGGESLKPCGHFSHAARGVGLDKQRNVVGHYFQRMNGYSNLLRFEPQQRLKPSFDRPGENRADILGTRRDDISDEKQLQCFWRNDPQARLFYSPRI